MAQTPPSSPAASINGGARGQPGGGPSPRGPVGQRRASGRQQGGRLVLVRVEFGILVFHPLARAVLDPAGAGDGRTDRWEGVRGALVMGFPAPTGPRLTSAAAGIAPGPGVSRGFGLRAGSGLMMRLFLCRLAASEPEPPSVHLGGQRGAGGTHRNGRGPAESPGALPRQCRHSPGAADRLLPARPPRCPGSRAAGLASTASPSFCDGSGGVTAALGPIWATPARELLPSALRQEKESGPCATNAQRW